MKKIAMLVAVVVVSIQAAADAAQPAAGKGLPAVSWSQELVRMKAAIMTADYRADIEALSRLRDELAPWPKERELAYLARYWTGFASWRIAMNGANLGMKSGEQAAHLRDAATDFYASIRLADGFADAYAAAALVNSWLAVFSADDAPAFRERISLSYTLLARATALDPENPRVLWAKGGFLLFAPQSRGGNITGAIEVYRRMSAEAVRRGVDRSSPAPDWGRAESLMSLAYAHLRQTPSDPASAHREASAALELQPQWAYVRDTLMRQIDEELHQER